MNPLESFRQSSALVPALALLALTSACDGEVQGVRDQLCKTLGVNGQGMGPEGYGKEVKPPTFYCVKCVEGNDVSAERDAAAAARTCLQRHFDGALPTEGVVVQTRSKGVSGGRRAACSVAYPLGFDCPADHLRITGQLRVKEPVFRKRPRRGRGNTDAGTTQ